MPEPDPMPFPEVLPEVPAELEPAAQGCREEDPEPCMELGGHFARAGSDEALLARVLFLRAADLARRGLPEAPGGNPTLTDPAAVTAAFRQAWFGSVLPSLPAGHMADLATVVSECMTTDAQYVIREIPRRRAFFVVYALRHDFPDAILAGDVESLAGEGHVWSVTFLGASRRFPPSGAFGGFIDPATGGLLVAIHYPEG